MTMFDDDECAMRIVILMEKKQKAVKSLFSTNVSGVGQFSDRAAYEVRKGT